MWPRSTESIHGSSNVKAKVNAVADSGCQTTTAGIELLERLAINEQQLLGIRRGIVGILDMNLDIRGVLILDIYANGYHTKQLVYISGNSKGFFLSQWALKDLKMLNFDDIQFKSPAQKRFYKTISTKDITFGIGPAGCGKTYLSVHKALRELGDKDSTIDGIVIVKPLVEAVDTVTVFLVASAETT